MIICYYNSFGSQKEVDIKKIEQIKSLNDNGKYYIINKRRVNDSCPQKLGQFEAEEIRDKEMDNLKKAFELKVAKYTIQNSKTQATKPDDYTFFN